MSATISVRKAIPADTDTLFQLYIDNGGGKIGQKRDLLRNGLRKLASSPGLGFHIVAEAEGETVGMLRVCFEWSPYRDGTFWWVENVYVVPDWRRKGVYRAMHKHVHSEAEEDPTVCGIRLYTDEDNHGARRTYESVGMNGYMMELFETDFVYGPRPT
ncbi:MAG: GNAT family N-acetyltransferase [Chloroflexi bacterium]|nr:GNAT family N-acetyltransferase [Chloroflexota bacterium]